MNVLITSISRKVPMVKAVRRALDRIVPGAVLYGGDCDAGAIARRFVDEFWEMEQDDYLRVEDFLDFCKSHDVRWIVPSRDGELVSLAAWQTELAAEGVDVMISPLETVRACVDKLRFYERLKSMREVVPTFQDSGSRNDTHWVVKERVGAGSREILLDLSLKRARRLAGRLRDPLFQPFFKGVEYSVDLYRSRVGEVWGCVVRTRDRIADGESQVSTIVRHEALEKVCRRAAKKLGITGHAVFQAIEDGNGKLHLFECNCRFGGASTLSVAGGLESFEWFFRETTENGFRPRKFVRGTPGLQLIRYPTDRIVQSESSPGCRPGMSAE